MDALITLRVPLDAVGPNGPLDPEREASKAAEGIADASEALIENVRLDPIVGFGGEDFPSVAEGDPVHQSEVVRTVFGIDIGPSEYAPYRSLVAAPEQSLSGNLILRVGREHATHHGWQQTEYVVLTPDEARDFLAQCAALLS